MDNAKFDRLLVAMLTVGGGQIAFLKLFADTRPATAYVIGVVAGIAAARLMFEISKRARA